MIKENKTYWLDSNNNKWNKNKYTKEEAEVYSKRLKNCTDCTDCTDCFNCNNCFDCNNCSYCFNCNNCNNCSNCSYCSYCSNCFDCNNCTDYNVNPNRYSQKGLGQNYPNTCVYWDKEQINIQAICGCFKGTLKKFEKAVLKKYDKNHGYYKFIRITKTIMKLEKEN